jgi:hypothetical protein
MGGYWCVACYAKHRRVLVACTRRR